MKVFVGYQTSPRARMVALKMAALVGESTQALEPKL